MKFYLLKKLDLTQVSQVKTNIAWIMTKIGYINKAIEYGLGLIIEYINSNDETTIRKISDIDYSDEYGENYIRAFCYLRKEYRTFKISNILEIDGMFFCQLDTSSISKPNRFWKSFGEEYSLKEIWAAKSPGLYGQIEGNEADVISVQFADGSESYRLLIPLENGGHIEIKLSERSNLDEGDKVKISTITGQDNYKSGYRNVISVLRYDGELMASDSRGWEQNAVEHSLEEMWDSMDLELYEQIDGEYANVKALHLSNGLSYLRIMIPFKDGSEFELKLSGSSLLKEGDYVHISSIWGNELNKKDCNPIIRYDGRNAKRWMPVGAPKNLKEILSKKRPGLYNQIDGNEAKVIAKELPNGYIVLKINLPLDDGSILELPVSPNSYLDEDDEVLVATIIGQEYHKKGYKDTIFYDGDFKE